MPGEYWSVVTPLLSQQAQQLESLGVEGLFAPQVYGPPFIPLAAGASCSGWAPASGPGARGSARVRRRHRRDLLRVARSHHPARLRGGPSFDAGVAKW